MRSLRHPISVLLIGITGQLYSLGSAQAQSVLDGPDSVAQTLSDEEGLVDPLTDPQYRSTVIEDTFSAWFEFKDYLDETHQLNIGFDYSVAGQATNSDLGDDTAVGHVVRFFGTWTPVHPAATNSGSLVFKVENRLGYTRVAPADLATSAGAVGQTAVQFTNAGWVLTNLYWKQKFFDDRLTLIFGQIDVTDYFDVYPLGAPLTAFQNSVFNVSPAIAVPGQGLGAGASFWFTDNFYAIAGIADANGDASDPNFDVFETGETFQSIEVGYALSKQEPFLNNIHVTAWSMDGRVAAGVPSDRGISASLFWTFDDRWAPFVRAGVADGGAAVYQASAGGGLAYLTPQRDLMAIGLNWARPDGDEDLTDQWTAEAFYRYQASKQFAVTLNGQLIGNPADNPDQDLIGFLGLRTRLEF